MIASAPGASPTSSRPFFEALPEAGFCLDVAHAWSIDPTMDVARELLDRFRSRLRQVHLSSLSGGHHVPLTDRGRGAVCRRAGSLPGCAVDPGSAAA